MFLGTKGSTRDRGPVRLAFEVQNIDEVITTLREAGARVLADPVRTPWGHLNTRLETPDGMQLLNLSLPQR